jgi:glycerol uptake facilitator-like aquaporin
MPRIHARAWLSEFVGTTTLLVVSVVVVRWLFAPDSAVARAVPGLPGRLALDGLVTGLLIMVLVASPLGRSSGGHFNPGVTVTFWLLREVPGGDAIGYVVAQMAGSVVGVLLARLALGPVVADPSVNYAVIHAAAGWPASAILVGEAVSLAALMAAVVGFLCWPSLAHWTPVVVGTGVGLLILAGGLTSGGCFNPARQFGPALFAGAWSTLWAYLLGPVIGGVAIAVVARRLRLPLFGGPCGRPPRDVPSPAPRRRHAPVRPE